MMYIGALCCWSFAFLVFSQAGLSSSHPVTRNPSSDELRSLQDLLERLKETFQEDEWEAGEMDDGADFDLSDSEAPPSGQLRVQTPLHQAEVEDHWRKFLASPKRRRHFSGCFGTRLERIGTQTGLGCNIYKAQGSPNTQ
ncbi:natriuretic peptides B-like [Rhineura floridana]|uniref:natriuretic peptides B-like n=1 Tax=Rhineura floridana TaxID=261503 RepID=UPI002AC869AC|nr:natriuretic peptides B-like [Rhineura floridana]